MKDVEGGDEGAGAAPPQRGGTDTPKQPDRRRPVRERMSEGEPGGHAKDRELKQGAGKQKQGAAHGMRGCFLYAYDIDCLSGDRPLLKKQWNNIPALKRF